MINDGHYFPRIRGIPIDGLNEPLTIIEGSSDLKYQGKNIALDGMQTACGAKLIASQKGFLVME
ncbi:PAAR domain-containing protein [Xenorhabdus sp. PR6a]|uniref:PAAR domain-containing protein n=1 Tax=Xenorhabdus sp. PR6a TaxID=3025877 RepID=UPI003FD5D843